MTPADTPVPPVPAGALALAQALAQEAARQIEAGSTPEVIEKAPGDWCSDLDQAIEQHMRQRIAEAFPDHGFWGEETGGQDDPVSPQAQPFVWLVDPIDGSMNFLRGYPQYAVSVALLCRGEPVVGCILDPVRGELFSAQRGQGATCNGRPIRAAATDRLSQALAATVFPKPRSPLMPAYLPELTAVLQGTAGLRRAGSMALELAYLAAGRIDAFWQRGMGAWDAAAGLLLIREAGGALWCLDGLPWWRSAAMAASAPALQADWQALLAQAAGPAAGAALPRDA